MVQVPVGLGALHAHLHPRGGEGAAAGLAHGHAHPLEAEPRGQQLHLGGRPAGRDQRGERHVAADAGEAVEVGDAHG